jgi:hypothetical protein
MHEVSGLRLLRVLRGQTLADVSKAVKCQRGHLSECEHDPSAAGRLLREKLQEFHGAKWSLLSATIDSARIATALINNTAQKESSNAK